MRLGGGHEVAAVDDGFERWVGHFRVLQAREVWQCHGDWVRGQRPHFGPGVVLSSSGSGPSQKLKIRFDRAGIKTLVVRYANLELD